MRITLCFFADAELQMVMHMLSFLSWYLHMPLAVWRCCLRVPLLNGISSFLSACLLSFFVGYCYAQAQTSSALQDVFPPLHLQQIQQQQNITQNSSVGISLGKQCFVFIDSSKTLTITDVCRPTTLSRFRPSAQEIPNFGFAKPTYWFAFSLRKSASILNDWVLEIAYPPLDSIEIFEFTSQSPEAASQQGSRLIRRALLGDMLPYAHRFMDTRTYAIPLDLRDTLPHTFFVRVNTQSSVQVPLYLHHHTGFSEQLSRSELAYGIFFGVMAALICYNVFLFVSLRSRYYVYYIVYLLGASLYIAVVNGFAAQYLWGNFPWWANYMNSAAIGVMISGVSVFAREFLQVRRYAPVMAKALIISMLAGVFVILSGFILPYRVCVQMSVVVNILTIILLVVSGAIVWARGNTSVRFFFLAAALFLTGNILFVMKTVGILPTNPITTHIAELGVMTEGLLFAFALADRYRLMRVQREEAQQEALRIEHAAKVQLEGKVRERTAELEAMNDEMQRQMVILNEQAIEIEMTNVALQEKNLLLENLNHEKNEFMGIAVHDLKNPLQTIIMNTSMMRRYRDKMDNEQRDYLFERIEETTRRMHNIITNLLDANAIEMGKVEFSQEKFPIYEEIRALVDDYIEKASAKRITMSFEPENKEICVFADKHRTMEVIENLLSNAVKFSPKDKRIVIRIAPHSSNDKPSGQMVRIEVQDEGPGLSAEDKAKLFGKFARLSAQPTGGEHSTGLGLSIVKRFVEAMNGEIWCESEEGKGATFVLLLPMDRT